jgi:hypothetical protein
VLRSKADIFFIAGQSLLFKPVKGTDQHIIMVKDSLLSLNGVLRSKADIFFIAGQSLLFKPVKGIVQLTI